MPDYTFKKDFALRGGLCAALALAAGLSARPAAAAPFAYVTNETDGTVSVVDIATNTVVGSPITVGGLPVGVAVTPNGNFVYVANSQSNTVSVIATASNTVVGTPIPVGSVPEGVAVTPDGQFVYVTNQGSTPGTVSVIATATNTVLTGAGFPIAVGTAPNGVAVTPDGKFVYVANELSSNVSVIATATNTVLTGAGFPIAVGRFPFGVAVTPDGKFVYVTNATDFTVSVISTASNTVTTTVGTPGQFSDPFGLAVTPDGNFVYVANFEGNSVSVIATATNTVLTGAGFPIAVGTAPEGVTVTPDGKFVYVTNSDSKNVSAIATASNTVVGTPIAVGKSPQSVGISPPPPPCLSSDATLSNINFPATGEVTFDVSSPTRTLSSITLLSSTNVGSFTAPTVVSASSATGGDAKKTNTSTSASFELRVVFATPEFICAIDPAETTLKITAGNKVVQAFGMIAKSEHFVEIDNGNPGLRWVRIAVDGKYARSVSLTSGGTVHVDLSAFMTLAQNTLTFTGEGKAGAFANLDLSDSVPSNPKLPKDREAGTWGHQKLALPAEQ